MDQAVSSCRAFLGTSENAVKAQIWIVVFVYVLVAIVKKRLALFASPSEIMQILSLMMFERIPLDHLLLPSKAERMLSDAFNQFNLFE